ncbi:MAG: lipoate--protein ligase family protein [Candidatus Thermoplasmatota archaeon]|nr:lipoate--protein ligase family protein [Candidatus Thermoplasmatota archaeon]MBU4255939.1 lipoate--protein ligase family protein [Candidatus Thermoplasmatota archaeon]MCG2827166.1 lipoate--protein ligase family protein [Thermoplasmatales archaeon]
MKVWRLIDTDLGHPFYVTALDEAIAIARKNNVVSDTLHFYRREPPGISVGYFQTVKDIDLELCRKHNVVVVRRTSGGGTIYTDKHQLIYALIMKTSMDTEKIFQMVCISIVEALQALGVSAEYKKPNDVTVNGVKISGSAIMRKGDVVLVHGTIMIDCDLRFVCKLLKISKPITTLNRYKMSMSEMKNMLRELLGKTFNVKIIPNSLTVYEKTLAEKLVKEKYSRDEWNLKR